MSMSLVTRFLVSAHRPGLWLVALAGVASAQTVWTVDDDGPADFNSIASAVSNAADGDTILVRSGTYGRAVVAGKGLTIQGVGKPRPLVDSHPTGAPGFGGVCEQPAFEVRDVGPGSTFVLSDVDVVSQGPSEQFIGSCQGAALRVENCEGPVHIERCRLESQRGNGAILQDCESVTFAQAEIYAGSSYLYFAYAGVPTTPIFRGLVVYSSRAYLNACTVVGGPGYDAEASGAAFMVLPADPGGPGIDLAFSSELTASDCLVVGGAAGATDPAILCQVGPNGGRPSIAVRQWAISSAFEERR